MKLKIIYTRKDQQRQILFCEKITKIDKSLMKLIKKKRKYK